MSQQWTENIGKPLGRECPRVELWSELAPEAEILEFALSENLRPGLGLRASLVQSVYGLSDEELNDALSRVSATLSNRDVSAILHPKLDS